PPPLLAAVLVPVLELPLSLLSSLPQAATPNVRAAAAMTETHFVLRMESTLLLEVQGTGTVGGSGEAHTRASARRSTGVENVSASWRTRARAPSTCARSPSGPWWTSTSSPALEIAWRWHSWRSGSSRTPPQAAISPPTTTRL